MNRTNLRHEIQPTPIEVTKVLTAQAQIGEGPVWDVRSQRLLWVDILGRALNLFNPADGTNESHELDDIVTSASPRAGGGVLLTLRRSFAFFDLLSGRLESVAEVEPDLPGNRFNDGKTDRRGRHWAGTMGDVHWNQPVGNLYRISEDLKPMLMAERLRCSNGIAWSPDDKTMYLCESFAHVIHAYDFDAESGAIANRRVFSAVSPESGSFPDGLTVDAEGGVWSAQPVYGRLVRYDPQGKIERIYELPVSRGTSVMFGGPELDTLYITTMQSALDHAQLAEEPLAGCLLALKPGVKGIAEVPFAG
jgi:sugar lactone lactonase YvrE